MPEQSESEELLETVKTYIRDLEVMTDARAALHAQPEGGQTEASWSRLLAVVTLNAFESVFKLVGGPLADAYLGPKKSNRERHDRLLQELRTSGVDVEPHVVEDFLALKYLRNTWSHGRWKEHEREHVERTGFNTRGGRFIAGPLDDWRRIIDTSSTMLQYVLEAAYPTVLAALAPSTAALRQTRDAVIDLYATLAAHRSPVRFVVNLQTPEHVGWRVLEALHTLAGQGLMGDDEVPRAVPRALGAWTVIWKGLRTQEHEAESSLAFLEGLAEEHRYARVPVGYDLAKLRAVADHLPDELGAFGRLLRSTADVSGPVWSEQVPVEIAHEFLAHAVPSVAVEDGPMLLHALRLGARCYGLARNRAASVLLKQLLEKAPQDDRAALERAARQASLATSLKETWYEWVETTE